MAKKKKSIPTKAKAKQILREGTAQGKKLTAGQKRYFGFIAGGGIPTRLQKRKKKKR